MLPERLQAAVADADGPTGLATLLKGQMQERGLPAPSGVGLTLRHSIELKTKPSLNSKRGAAPGSACGTSIAS